MTNHARHPIGVTRALLALALVALCWRIGSYPLLEPDEGRNVEVAREMARTGDYVLPHLNGLPYLDKPAPYFAAVAVSVKLFSASETAARLASLVCTLLSVALVFRFGRRLGEPITGDLSALALATMPLVLAFSRTVIFDPALAFLETLGLYAAWCALEGGLSSGRWSGLMWAALGLGTITKGPVALLIPLLVLGVYALTARVSLRPLFRHGAWLWFLIVGLPWFVAVSLRRPDFPHYAFIYESFERVTTGTMGRGGPLWYFIPIALAGAFPWSGPALAGAARAWRRRGERLTPEARPAIFLAAWALVPLVFFSLSQSKLPGYYLPALPAWALAAGLWTAHVFRREPGPPRAALYATAAVLALLGVAAVAAPHLPSVLRPLTAMEREALPAFTLLIGGGLVAAAVLVAAGAHRARLVLVAGGLALPTVMIPLTGTGLLRAIGHRRSSYALAEAIERAAPGAEVVGVGAWPTSLRFYLDRPVLLATATGTEMTSNYVASRLDEFRALPLTPLRRAGWWREALATCRVPTVFVTRRGSPADSALAADLPRIGTGGAEDRYAAYGPCLHVPVPPSSVPPSSVPR